jgi:rubrerythrin
MKMPKEMLEKNRMYAQQLMKVFGSKNIRKGGLNRIGEGFDKVEYDKLKQMIQENIMKAKKKKSQPKKEKGQPLEVDNKKVKSMSTSTSRGLPDRHPSEGDQTPYVNDIDNLVNIYINKNLKVTNGSSTYKVTEDDMKALELMIEDGRVTEKMYINAVNRSKDKTIKEIVVEIADDLI